MELMDIWDRIQKVRLCLSVEDRWVWMSGSHDGFLIASVWDTIRPHSIRVGWSSLMWGGENIRCGGTMGLMIICFFVSLWVENLV